MNFVPYPELTGKGHVTGRDLVLMVRGTSAYLRASTALAFAEGAFALVNPTRTQAAMLMGASPYNMGLVSIATEDEREALRLGFTTLANVRLAHAHTPDLMLESRVMATINYIGVNRLWSTFDRMTAPVADTPPTPSIR
jgi:hypothetical protein